MVAKKKSPGLAGGKTAKPPTEFPLEHVGDCALDEDVRGGCEHHYAELEDVKDSLKKTLRRVRRRAIGDPQTRQLIAEALAPWESDAEEDNDVDASGRLTCEARAFRQIAERNRLVEFLREIYAINPNNVEISSLINESLTEFHW